MSYRSFFRTSVAMLAVVAAACERNHQGDPETIRLEEDPTPGALRPAQECFPAVVVGSERIWDDGGSHWFGAVSRGTVTRDGTWVVSDVQRTVLHFIQPDGTHRLVGGPGDGPGEFRFLGPLWVTPDDAVAVVDALTGRVSLFHPSGEFSESLLPSGEGRIAGIVGEVKDGGVLLQRSLTRNSPGPEGGRWRDSLELVLSGAERDARRYGPFPGSDWYVDAEAGPMPVPFGLNAAYRLIRGELLLVASGELPEIELVDLIDGGSRTVPVPLQPRAVQPEMLDTAEELLEAGEWSPPSLEGMRRLLARREVPELTPAYGYAYFDRDGWIWVQEYPVPGEREAYLILDLDGQVLQRLVLPHPAPFRPPGPSLLTADDAHVLFRTEDDVGTPLLMVMDRRCRETD
jgi:hypothetical protein